jgi:chaperonin GroEL
MEKSNIAIGNELEGIINGIEQVSEVIRKSYGPKGMNVSIESNMMPGHLIANDADTVIQSVYCYDPVERRGLNFIKELSAKATKDSGEGRKTTIIMAETLLKEGLKAEVKGMKLKEELDALVPQVLESLDKQSQRVELEDIGNIAQTSSRSKELGEKIAEAYRDVGRDGIISCEASGTDKTFHTFTTGVLFKDAHWMSPYMARGASQMTFEKPFILVGKTPIKNEGEINAFMEWFINNGHRNLVIFCDNVDSRLLSAFAAANSVGLPQQGGASILVNFLVIQPPTLWKDTAFEDFAKCTGASILDENSGVNWKNLVQEISMGRFKLGTCDKLVCDAEDTLLTGIADITEHQAMLQKRVDDKEPDANDAKRRLWYLNTKTAIMKVGANSESELSYKLLKCKDALAACRAALMEGIVPGAANSLARTGEEFLPILSGANSAKNILKLSLQAPLLQLIENNNGEAIDLGGVYDATLVMKNAVKNAVSLAGIVMTLGADIRARDLTDQELQIKLSSIKNQQMFG